MNALNKMELLKQHVLKIREFQDQKKALSDEKKLKQSTIETIILNDGNEGNIDDCRRLQLSILSIENAVKDLSAEIRRLNSNMEKIIMGEADYDDDQMTFDDVAEEKKFGAA